MRAGNPLSLMPVPHDQDGDAESARRTSKLAGFSNTIFEILNGENGDRTYYDGVNAAKIIPNQEK